ncbi:hypothetical protein H696_05564 [Fonticula alba]|uniref:Uncharacterized protein n=1 Tax=Fonticula alba TaxID=691883 RepID=A0A058Z2T2_FONAL|nr:hypothetical protein H696_05564 [Fonticula alba]KCV67832.1 hypothetical protein H696_05564 [Fonticula alba]|eukprot:XP_009497652.1 hypothetical protein H696_05564 [Fonticula alba]
MHSPRAPVAAWPEAPRSPISLTSTNALVPGSPLFSSTPSALVPTPGHRGCLLVVSICSPAASGTSTPEKDADGYFDDAFAGRPSCLFRYTLTQEDVDRATGALPVAAEAAAAAAAPPMPGLAAGPGLLPPAPGGTSHGPSDIVLEAERLHLVHRVPFDRAAFEQAVQQKLNLISAHYDSIQNIFSSSSLFDEWESSEGKLAPGDVVIEMEEDFLEQDSDSEGPPPAPRVTTLRGVTARLAGEEALRRYIDLLDVENEKRRSSIAAFLGKLPFMLGSFTMSYILSRIVNKLIDHAILFARSPQAAELLQQGVLVATRLSESLMRSLSSVRLLGAS